jgi:hypothetical protein
MTAYTGAVRQAAILLGLVLAWLPFSALAQNLLANSRFDGDLSGWTPVGSANAADGARVYAPFPEDFNGSPTSGSARLSLTAAAAVGIQIGLAQCIPVSVGSNYNYGTRLKAPTGQSVGDLFAFVEVEFFTDATCTTSLNEGEGQGAVIGVAYPLDDTLWRALPGTIPASAPVVTAPVGAVRAMVRVLVERGSGNQAGQALFDNAFFGIGLTPVELQSFTVE